jgi:hypothetical protein
MSVRLSSLTLREVELESLLYLDDYKIKRNQGEEKEGRLR